MITFSKLIYLEYHQEAERLEYLTQKETSTTCIQAEVKIHAHLLKHLNQKQLNPR